MQIHPIKLFPPAPRKFLCGFADVNHEMDCRTAWLGGPPAVQPVVYNETTLLTDPILFLRDDLYFSKLSLRGRISRLRSIFLEREMKNPHEFFSSQLSDSTAQLIVVEVYVKKQNPPFFLFYVMFLHSIRNFKKKVDGRCS